jgi:hypothetical protein
VYVNINNFNKKISCILNNLIVKCIMDWVYDVSNSVVLFTFIIIIVFLSIIGLIIFTLLTSCGFMTSFNNEAIGVYIGVLAIVVGIVIAFIISDLWQKFHEAETNMAQEANILYQLYNTLVAMPRTEISQVLLINYICYIINIEFPSLENGITSTQGTLLIDALRKAIYGYIPINDREQILYAEALTLFNRSQVLRTSRIESALVGLAPELWWVMILGLVLLIVMSWFITGDFWFRVTMVTFLATGYASMIFLVVALDYPFKGDLGLSPTPFEFVLTQIGVTCPSSQELNALL